MPRMMEVIGREMIHRGSDFAAVSGCDPRRPADKHGLSGHVQK
jgi:hypothetical protein